MRPDLRPLQAIALRRVKLPGLLGFQGLLGLLGFAGPW
jgi:hypothetical protein